MNIFKIHDWNKWEDVAVEERCGLSGLVWIQTRTCECCNKRQFRKIRASVTDYSATKAQLLSFLAVKIARKI